MGCRQLVDLSLQQPEQISKLSSLFLSPHLSLSLLLTWKNVKCFDNANNKQQQQQQQHDDEEKSRTNAFCLFPCNFSFSVQFCLDVNCATLATWPLGQYKAQLPNALGRIAISSRLVVQPVLGSLGGVWIRRIVPNIFEYLSYVVCGECSRKLTV